MEMTSGGKRAQNRTLSSKIISQLCFLKVLIRESHEVMNILCPTSEQTKEQTVLQRIIPHNENSW